MKTLSIWSLFVLALVLTIGATLASARSAEAQYGPCPRGYFRNRFGRCELLRPMAPPPSQCPPGSVYSNGRCWRTSPGCPTGFVRNRFGRCLRTF
ncbi:MAG: hypothetical protein JNK05_41000 [Myxococcales bacterium]|nr:hypothetical protein [Myxococcales bacterium]